MVVLRFDGEELRLIHRKRDLEFWIVSPDHRKQRFVCVCRSYYEAAYCVLFSFGQGLLGIGTQRFSLLAVVVD